MRLVPRKDANDVDSVGGSVRGEYINKEKGSKKDKTLKALAKSAEQTNALLQKMASRPRSGGPVLDGQARGAFPANEARLSEPVTKAAEDPEVERLTKAVGRDAEEVGA